MLTAPSNERRIVRSIKNTCTPCVNRSESPTVVFPFGEMVSSMAAANPRRKALFNNRLVSRGFERDNVGPEIQSGDDVGQIAAIEVHAADEADGRFSAADVNALVGIIDLDPRHAVVRAGRVDLLDVAAVAMAAEDVALVGPEHDLGGDAERGVRRCQQKRQQCDSKSAHESLSVREVRYRRVLMRLLVF